jgi:mannose-6-phosphate isomerase
MPIRRIIPSFKERVWGVTRLEPWFPNQSAKTGEVWFEAEGELPLLVKFLFTSANLSVQVHPDDAAAREHNSLGKTEMWHILAAEPGAKIAAGFREPITKERLRESAISGEIESLLEWHDAAPGDTFFIPAGVVHAIGAGIVLCEIQQASDITYRLYDYGRGRELHLDQSVKVSHLGPHAARVGSTVSCEYFTVALGNAGLGNQVPAKFPAMAIVIEGSGEIAGSRTNAGDVWMLDAPVELSGGMQVLVASEGSAR